MNLYRVPQLPGKKSKNGKGLKKNKGKSKDSGVLTVGRIILLTFLSLLFILFLLIYIFLNFTRPSTGDSSNMYSFVGEFGLEGDDGEDGELRPPFENLSKDRNPDCYTFLILGSDNGVNTDTIMAAMFNVKESTISILNIPRDSYVTTKNFSGKITNVYGTGRRIARENGFTGSDISHEGLKYLCAMVEYTFGIPIQKYVLINLEGFKFLVDKIGGVEFDVPLRMYYTDPSQKLYIDLQPGLQPLNGDKAEQVVRFRHGNKGYPGYPSIGYPSEDIGRIKTQQHFMAAVMKKIINPIDVSNIKSLFTAASNYSVTNMTLADISWFGVKMTGVKLENIRTHALDGFWISPRLEIYKKEAMEIINKYYNPYKIEIPESNFNIYDKSIPAGYKPDINIDGETMDKLVK